MRDDERKFAALAHALNSVPLWGVLGAGAVWLFFKERSREVVFHAQQAIFFHVAVLAFFVVFILIGIFGGIVSLISEGLGEVIKDANLLFLVLCLIAYAATCLYGAYRTLSGSEFLYPLIGPRMAEGYRRSTGE
jgi:uncharacterized Tic20 family protein